MRKIKRKKKQSNTDKYWEVFGGFCFSCNESRTFREIIDRVNFFNRNQTFTKKTPPSATPENACMLWKARRLFYGKPQSSPDTLWQYKREIVKSLYYFSVWLQDAFKELYGESQVYPIMTLLEPYLMKRFADLYPDAAKVEMSALLLREKAKLSISEDDEDLVTVDQWRQDHPDSFHTLQALLSVEKIPRFARDAISELSTAAVFRQACIPDNSEHFFWDGKDIARYLSEIDEPYPSQLIFKEELFEKEINECGAVAFRDMETHVHKVAPPTDEKDLIDWKKEGRIDESKNHYIEGDNIRALRLLAPQYEKKVKMIYIDPPYNTGHQFIYKDAFKSPDEIYKRFLLHPIPRPRETLNSCTT